MRALAGDAATELDRAAPPRRAGRPSVARPLSGEYPEDLRQQVEDYLAELRFADRRPRARPAWTRRCATRCSPAASGSARCWRSPTARAVGRDPARVLPLAAALELIHTYSLIHDDLPAMDDDDLRRGRPTCHKAFGEDVAILAGDGLYAEAFRHVLTHQAGDPAAILAAVGELAAATGVNGMVGGQYLDVTERAPAGRRGPAHGSTR